MPEGGSKEREKKVLRIPRKENSTQRFTSVSDPYSFYKSKYRYGSKLDRVQQLFKSGSVL